MHVGLITYQTGHLKTFQLLLKLQTKSFEISVYAFPFVHHAPEKKIFSDRPYQIIPLTIKDYCERHGISYVKVKGWSDENAVEIGLPGHPDTPDVYLTCIAKIIPRSFIEKRIIINAHPGLLPWNRGIDAFKWSIVNCWPVGISIHVIDEHIDRGRLLHRMRIPVIPNDELCDVAERAYQMEVDLHANFDYHLSNLENNYYVSNDFPLSKNKIPDETDRRLEKIFLKHRKTLVRLSAEKGDVFARTNRR